MPLATRCRLNDRRLVAITLPKSCATQRGMESIELKNKHDRYRYLNGHILAAKQALDRARKICAAPPWLNEHHLDTIEMIFGEAWMRSNFVGPQVVDHIVPLKGRCPITKERNVCGLHVPWNLRALPEQANRQKADWFVSDWVSSEDAEAALRDANATMSFDFDPFTLDDGDGKVPF